MNIGMHVSFCIIFFGGYMPRSGIDGYMTTLFLEKTLYFEIILDLQKSYKDGGGGGGGAGNLNKETLKDRESAPAGGETRSQGAGLGGSLEGA